jgi:hypothetical protein
MSALASLVRAYDRLFERGKVPAFGYSVEKVGFLIPLNDDGSLAGPPIDLREGEGKKRPPRPMHVPASFKRPGTTPRSFFLWDIRLSHWAFRPRIGRRALSDLRHSESCTEEGLPTRMIQA